MNYCFYSWVHLVGNVAMQLFLGILLEMVHRWWRVLIVYFAGVIAGSLATSLTDPYVFLAGASGGVYALITAHLATVILVSLDRIPNFSCFLQIVLNIISRVVEDYEIMMAFNFLLLSELETNGICMGSIDFVLFLHNFGCWGCIILSVFWTIRPKGMELKIILQF